MKKNIPKKRVKSHKQKRAKRRVDTTPPIFSTIARTEKLLRRWQVNVDSVYERVRNWQSNEMQYALRGEYKEQIKVDAKKLLDHSMLMLKFKTLVESEIETIRRKEFRDNITMLNIIRILESNFDDKIVEKVIKEYALTWFKEFELINPGINEGFFIDDKHKNKLIGEVEIDVKRILKTIPDRITNVCLDSLELYLSNERKQLISKSQQLIENSGERKWMKESVRANIKAIANNEGCSIYDAYKIWYAKNWREALEHCKNKKHYIKKFDLSNANRAIDDHLGSSQLERNIGKLKRHLEKEQTIYNAVIRYWLRNNQKEIRIERNKQGKPVYYFK